MLLRACGSVGLILLLLQGGRAADPPEGWQELKTSSGRARVFVPKAPGTSHSTSSVTVNGVQTQVSMTVSGGQNEAFGVCHVENPKDGKRRDPQQHLNLVRDAVLQKLSGRLLSEKRITFGAKRYPGRELVANCTFQGQPFKLHSRVYLIDNHGVSLFAVSRGDMDVSKKVNQFYKSFEWNPEASEQPKSPPGSKKPPGTSG